MTDQRGREEAKKCIYGCGQPALYGKDVCEFCQVLEDQEADQQQWEQEHGY